MTAEIPGQGERGIRQEALRINLQTLWNDNHSLQADAARDRWNEKRIQGKLRGIVRCSDARLKSIGDNSVSVGTIAAAGEVNPLLVSDRGLESIIVVTHINGDTIKPGEMPTGCGGLRAKGRIGNTPQEDGIGSYILGRVPSDDALVTAIDIAKKLALKSVGKPTLAAIMDHRNYSLYPVGFYQFERHQWTEISSITEDDMENYDPQRIYENGIPTIEERVLPAVLEEAMEENRREANEIFARYPDLSRLQEVQKPRIVDFSTDIRSARVRYPDLSLPPGSVFKVHVPRQKIGEEIQVSDHDLGQALNQLQYPIEHAVDNHDDPTKEFSNTDRVLFETGDIDLSRKLAHQALRRTWMKKWISLPDRRIILVQTNAGISNIVEELGA